MFLRLPGEKRLMLLGTAETVPRGRIRAAFGTGKIVRGITKLLYALLNICYLEMEKFHDKNNSVLNMQSVLN